MFLIAMLLRLVMLLLQSRELCRVARAWTRLGQAVATSMELGLSKSRLLGIGLEYADFREYQEGDDVRYVDWALSARSVDSATGEYKLYTKVFHVEQMKNIVFVTDLTNSMLVEEKVSALFYISSLLLELSHRLSDKVTLITLSNKVNTLCGLRGREAMRVLEDIVCKRQEVGGGTRIGEIVGVLKALAKKSTAIAVPRPIRKAVRILGKQHGNITCLYKKDSPAPRERTESIIFLLTCREASLVVTRT